MTSTATGRSKVADDMRVLANSVRAQQEKAAEYVFGQQEGKAVIDRLRTLDTRYRNLMEATNGGKIEEAAKLKGEAGRDADRKFRAFAHDDPVALRAWTAMRKGGSNVENDVRTLVGMEKIPYLGAAVTWAKMAGRMREWAAERAAGNPSKFEDFIKMPEGSGKTVRDISANVGARMATMGAKQAPDGNYYVPDPQRPGKYLMVKQSAATPRSTPSRATLTFRSLPSRLRASAAIWRRDSSSSVPRQAL